MHQQTERLSFRGIGGVVSQGKLDLLIAVCDSRNLQEQIIQQYLTELRQQNIAHYRVLVNRSDPSLRFALEQLLTEHPQLQTGEPGVVTVQGIDDLLAFKLDSSRSEQERLFGYLQWTREAFRKFQFPIVLWVPSAIVTLLVEQAPDFWSWRGGILVWSAKVAATYSIRCNCSRVSRSGAT